MEHKNFYKIFIAVISFLLFIQIPVQADIQEIAGVPFYVDKIEFKPNDLVLLGFDGDEKLIEKENLNEAILDLYFSPEAKYDLSLGQVKKFVVNSLTSGDLNYAKKAVNALLQHSSIDEEKISEIFEVLPDRSESLDLLYYSYSLLKNKNDKQKLKNILFLLIGLKDSEWLLKNSSNLSEDDKTILEIILNTYFGASFFENDIALRNKLLIFEKNVFGPTSSIYQKHIKIDKNVELVMPQLQNFNFSAINKLIQLIQYDSELRVALMPFVRDRIHACVENALDRGKIDKALEVISLIRKDWRTEDTYLLVKRVLEEAIRYENVIFIESRFNDLVSDIVSEDQKSKQEYLDLLSKQVDLLLEKKYLSHVGQILNYIVTFRPDPNQENDIIRAKEILFLAKNGQKNRAKAKLITIKTSLPLMIKLRFLMAGLYPKFWKYLFVIVLLVVVTILIVYSKNSDFAFFKKFKVFFEEKKNKFGKNEDNDEPYNGRLFVSNNMEARYNPKFEAYQNCLRELGLPKDVSLKAIKVNYRKMIKTYHPDYHPDLSPEDHAKFIKFTKLYKEVFDLRGELGLPNEL